MVRGEGGRDRRPRARSVHRLPDPARPPIKGGRARRTHLERGIELGVVARPRAAHVRVGRAAVHRLVEIGPVVARVVGARALEGGGPAVTP